MHLRNIDEARATFVTHLECSATGEHYAPDRPHGLSRAGKPLLVRYALDEVRNALTKEAIENRPPDMWRYRELLPIRQAANIVSLGETMTPLIRLENRVFIKDESRLPTGSFKARGMAVAVSMAKEFGLAHLAAPTNGNAGAALAAYAARAAIRATVFCPDDTPEINIRETAAQGADVYRVNGLIDQCGKLVAAGRDTIGWFDMSTLKEPYRLEGKKTMGFELVEQLGWEVPDVIFYPTGGGTGLIGMWKAFDELEAVGLIGRKRPRMVAVQAAGCAPIVRAYERGENHAGRCENAHTIASGIRVPSAIGDFLILDAVRKSRGFAIAVEDEDIAASLDEVARGAGFLLCPEAAAAHAAWRKSLHLQRVDPDACAVIFNCASGLKYPLPESKQRLDLNKPVDFAQFRGQAGGRF
jgi:threonine synthase